MDAFNEDPVNPAAPENNTTTPRRSVLLRIRSGLTDVQRRAGSVRAADEGFDGVELCLDLETMDAASSWMPGTPQPSGQLEATVVGAVAAPCRTTNLPQAVAETAELLSRAATLGARCLNLTIPPVRGSSQAPGPEPTGMAFDRYQAALNFAFGLLHELRFEAERLGVALALEAGANGCLLSPVELREVIDAANSWAVGACIDTDRIARLGPPEDWLTTLNQRVHCVRASVASVPEGRAPSTNDATGMIETVVPALDAIRYGGPVILTATEGSFNLRSLVEAFRCTEGDASRRLGGA